MTAIERTLRRVDAFQQRHTPTAMVVGVVKKYGDDRGGNLAVQLSYSMFVTIFPLLLLMVTVLGIVLAHDPSARARLSSSAFGEFPIVGPQLAHNIHALTRGTLLGVIAGCGILGYGAMGLAQSGLFAMAQIWDVPVAERPNYLTRLGRSLVFLVLLAVMVVITTALSSFGTFGRHNVGLGLVAEVAAGVVNVGLYLGGFRILTPRAIPTRGLVPGALVGGACWTMLQAAGGYVVGHDLKGASATYGVFALVLGLLAWLYLGAEVVLYSAEVNVVLERHLWPRALVQPPLTRADQESVALQTLEGQWRAEQEVVTHVRGRSMTEDEFRTNGYRLDEQAPGLSASTTERQHSEADVSEQRRPDGKRRTRTGARATWRATRPEDQGH